MHKFLTKIATLSVGLAMAVGVGVAVGSKSAKVSAADTTATLSPSKVTAAGTLTDDQAGSWAFTFVAADGTNPTSEDNGIHVGTNSKAVTSIDFECSSYSTSSIKSISVWAAAKNNTNVKTHISIGGDEVAVSSENLTNTFSTGGTELAYDNTTAQKSGTINVSVARPSSSTGAIYLNKIEVVYGPISTDPEMAIRTSSWGTSPFEMTYGDTTGLDLLGYDPDNEYDIWRSGMTWSFSNDTVVNHSENGDTWTHVTPKAVGSVQVTCSKEGYQDGVATINVVPGALTSIVVTGSMTKTSYYVGQDWDPAGLVATVNYDSGYSYDATEDVAWTFSPASPALGVDSVVATATLGTVSGNSASQSVSVSRTNPIQVLYTKSSGDSVDVYGYYVGFLDGTGPVVMDGEYGIVIYNKTADVSGYTAGETILHVTGSISIYKGLYEIGSASISVASGTYDVPSKPVVYSTQGGETADKASRLTTVTGTPTVTSGSFDDDAGTNDIKMNFTVGTKTVQVFYKKAAQTADAEAFAAIKSAATASPAQEITIKGFTGWYDGFQVQMNGYVPASEDYTAEDFSQDLLDQTDAVCAGYVSDESKFAEIKTALVAIWSDLASSDKYPSLPSAEKTILAEAERKESGTVVEQAMARYDFLTGKYDLINFINGRTPIVPVGAPAINTLDSSSVITIIVIASLLSVSTIGVCFIIRRRKMY